MVFYATVSANKIFSNRKYFFFNLQTSNKNGVFRILQINNKILSVGIFFFCEYNRLEYRDRYVVCNFEGRGIFFKRNIQPRGKSTAKNELKYHKLQSSANFFAQRGFMGIFNMSFLIPCRTKCYQKSFDINFFRVWPKIWVLLPAY